MFLFKVWFLFIFPFSSVTSKIFKRRSNHELTVLKRLIQTWTIFFLKGQKMFVLKIHYFIDGIHWSAYALGPIGKDRNLVHSPASPPWLSASVTVCVSAVLLHDKAPLKKSLPEVKECQGWTAQPVFISCNCNQIVSAANQSSASSHGFTLDLNI